MGRASRISWTDSTQNFWTGCHHVSEGCDHCYADRIVTVLWAARDGGVMGRSPDQAFGDLVQAPQETFRAPLEWPRLDPPRKVFTCSMSDFFHPHADGWREEAWDVIRRTPQHIWQILTKRPQMIASRLPPDWGEGWDHVWIGASVENQRWADIRIPILQAVPAKVRFLSIEPLLGPITFGPDIGPAFPDEEGADRPLLLGIHWAILGGESGPEFRPMEVEWARSVRRQCADAEVPFFYKQDSGRYPGGNPSLDGVTYHEFPRSYDARIQLSA